MDAKEEQLWEDWKAGKRGMPVLQQEGVERAEKLGHKLGPWIQARAMGDVEGGDAFMQEAFCVYCGLEVELDEPDPPTEQVRGRALHVRCSGSR